MTVERTMTFSGKGTAGNLLDPKNWVGGVVPGINDAAIITMAVGAPVGGTVRVNNMMILGSETTTFTGTLETVGAGGDCRGLMVCDNAIAVFAPGATLNDENVLTVGNDAVGTLLAEGSGTTHSVINSVVGKIGISDDAVGTVTIDDAIWNNSGAALIGYSGAGTLNVIDHGSVNFGHSVNVTVNAGSSGRINIASGGSVDVAGNLMLGNRAVQPDTTASISVGSGSSLTVDGSLYVSAGTQIDISGGIVTAGATANPIVVLAGGLISGYGTLAVTSGATMSIGGIIRASGGNLEVDGKIGGTTGTLQIAADSTATITSTTLKLAGISFIGPDATLLLAHGVSTTAPISGFAIGDVIGMANVDAAAFTASTGMLVLSDHGVKVDSLHLLGNFTGDTFAVQQTLSDSMITLHH
jgi:fibronectin-binding autotransporter adhesin